MSGSLFIEKRAVKEALNNLTWLKQAQEVFEHSYLPSLGSPQEGAEEKVELWENFHLPLLMAAERLKGAKEVFDGFYFKSVEKIEIEEVKELVEQPQPPSPVLSPSRVLPALNRFFSKSPRSGLSSTANELKEIQKPCAVKKNLLESRMEDQAPLIIKPPSLSFEKSLVEEVLESLAWLEQAQEVFEHSYLPPLDSVQDRIEEQLALLEKFTRPLLQAANIFKGAKEIFDDFYLQSVEKIEMEEVKELVEEVKEERPKAKKTGGSYFFTFKIDPPSSPSKGNESPQPPSPALSPDRLLPALNRFFSKSPRSSLRSQVVDSQETEAPLLAKKNTVSKTDDPKPTIIKASGLLEIIAYGGVITALLGLLGLIEIGLITGLIIFSVSIVLLFILYKLESYPHESKPLVEKEKYLNEMIPLQETCPLSSDKLNPCSAWKSPLTLSLDNSSDNSSFLPVGEKSWHIFVEKERHTSAEEELLGPDNASIASPVSSRFLSPLSLSPSVSLLSSPASSPRSRSTAERGRKENRAGEESSPSNNKPLSSWLSVPKSPMFHLR